MRQQHRLKEKKGLALPRNETAADIAGRQCKASEPFMFAMISRKPH